MCFYFVDYLFEFLTLLVLAAVTVIDHKMALWVRKLSMCLSKPPMVGYGLRRRWRKQSLHLTPELIAFQTLGRVSARAHTGYSIESIKSYLCRKNLSTLVSVSEPRTLPLLLLHSSPPWGPAPAVAVS